MKWYAILGFVVVLLGPHVQVAVMEHANAQEFELELKSLVESMGTLVNANGTIQYWKVTFWYLDENNELNLWSIDLETDENGTRLGIIAEAQEILINNFENEEEKARKFFRPDFTNI